MLSKLHISFVGRCILFLGIIFLGVNLSAGENRPEYVDQPLRSSSQAEVLSVLAAKSMDVVLLDGGYDQGFRSGMRCRVIGDDKQTGELILVEVRRNHSAALIIELSESYTIQEGDIARIKPLIEASFN